MRFCCLSDIHGMFEQMYDRLKDSKADVLLLTGDYCAWDRSDEYITLETYLDGLNFKYVVYIAGNHDGKIAQGRRLSNAIYLEDSAVEIGGIKIYGSPWSPIFYGWHFMLPREELAKKWSLIPKDTDILLTHTPPFGVFDYVDGRRAGCEELAARLNEITPKFHVFGHIHENTCYIDRSNSTSYINAAFYPDFEVPFEFDL